ncbi:MAG: hypothetical protein SPI16_04380 [Porphyromonas sp.]|uniref:hypothetical protein n=1 Tax=Porphyromonas sp. TaxID=1924944 RepID=UPI002A91B69D|nr:hypothetical protein [Porphyromonas sp.]MDY6102270.1 hypothetical protein [Porphyromonas sp.]
MGTHQENNKRIAKNTIVLYVRMIFVLLVALYTSRVLLDVLGVEDYGVYNVVGGVVTMLGFFNGAMVSSTQRFFSFAIGQEDIEQLNRNYSPLLRDEVQQGLYDPDGHSSQPLHRICGRSLEDHLASSDVQTQGIYLPFRNLSRPVGEGKVRLMPRLLLPT